VGVAGEEAQLYPARSDVGGGQRMRVLAGSGLAAVARGVDLPEAGLSPLFEGIEGADGDAAFRG
jgi:hypothetical protein